MKISRQSSYTIVFALSAALLAACGGGEAENPPPNVVPPAPTEPAKTPPPAATPAEVKPPEPVKTAEPVAAPAPKPLKERLVGVWQLEFSGDTKTAAEADAKKKAGKDEKKLADLMKKAEETAASDKVEATGDVMAWWTGDKTVSKAKYEIVKEDAATNTIIVKRVGKDEITKKDAVAAEISITIKDDSTIELRDPREKDQKKAKLLVFKKTATAPSSTMAAAPAPADKGGGAKPTGGAAVKPGTGDKAGGATPATPATPAKEPKPKQ